MSVFKGNSILLLLIVVIVLFSLQHGTDSVGTPFEYYQLVMRWPKAVCYHKPDQPYPCVVDQDHLPMRFTLHGLWATNWTNLKDEIKCDEAGIPFQIDEVYIFNILVVYMYVCVCVSINCRFLLTKLVQQLFYR